MNTETRKPLYYVPTSLLSKGSTNAKTKKNELESFILYLAPEKQNSKGVNLCPKASKGCAAACLYTAGRGNFDSVKKARINKADFFIHDKVIFLNKLAKELLKVGAKAKKQNKQIAVRLNGTSDLDFIALLKKYNNLDLLSGSEFENLVFYDYTAILGKVKKYIGTNYAVTLSRKENNETDILKALEMGGNVAAVFSGSLPKRYKGYEVVDGDSSDLVMLEARNCILGLKAKGKAVKDASGFVIHNINNFTNLK